MRGNKTDRDRLPVCLCVLSPCLTLLPACVHTCTYITSKCTHILQNKNCSCNISLACLNYIVLPISVLFLIRLNWLSAPLKDYSSVILPKFICMCSVCDTLMNFNFPVWRKEEKDCLVKNSLIMEIQGQLRGLVLNTFTTLSAKGVCKKSVSFQ